MSTITANLGSHNTVAERSNQSRQAYQILHLGFTVAPVLAGIDKFFHLLCNWINISHRGSPAFPRSVAIT
jgi:hypothetical protein